MERLIPARSVEIPAETLEILHPYKVRDLQMLWTPVPIMRPTTKRLSIREIEQNGQIDVYELLAPLLGNNILEGTLRTADVLNGCNTHCDTCCADSAFPTSMFSYESLARLFNDKNFIAMLQPDSLRFGSTGDIGDHPQGADIIRLALEGTAFLDKKRIAKEDRHHVIKVYVNYRYNKEDQIDELIDIAKKNPRRLDLTLSLPFNRNDAVNIEFETYVRNRKDVFGIQSSTFEDGMIMIYKSNMKLGNLKVDDFRHPDFLFTTGRALPEKTRKQKISPYSLYERGGISFYQHYTHAKTYLNPDGLWLKLYVTPYHSHTEAIFTLITQDNITILSQIPYCDDIPVPPNWPSGVGNDITPNMAQQIHNQLKASGRRMKPLTIVKV